MPLYRARLVGRSGRRSTLLLDAVDMASFSAHIEAHRKAYVIDIRRVSERKGRLARVRVPGALLMAALDSLELMLVSGVRVNAALRTLADCAPSGSARVLWTEVVGHVEQTGSFGDALRSFPRVFNASMVGVIAAHEAAGRLPEGVRHVRDYAAQMLALRREARRGLAYPALVCVSALGASAVLCGFTLPRFASMLRDIGVKRMNPVTSFFFGVSAFVVSHPLGAALLVAMPFLVGWAAFLPRVRPARDRMLLRIPVVRGAIEALSMARICATYRALSESGIRVVEALEACVSVAGNTEYAKAVGRVVAAVRDNATIGAGFEQAGLFSPEVVLAVRSGEGCLTQVFGRLSEYYASESKHRVAFALGLLEPAALVVVLCPWSRS
jgi:type IV pilus assembly protein PilC